MFTVSGSKVPKSFKDLRKLGVRNIEQYSAANVPFPAFFFPTDFLPYYPSCVWPARGAKPRFGAALVVLRMIVSLVQWRRPP